jgi:hypothetical protein
MNKAIPPTLEAFLQREHLDDLYGEVTWDM